MPSHSPTLVPITDEAHLIAKLGEQDADGNPERAAALVDHGRANPELRRR
jgi:hypothetical protein